MTNILENLNKDLNQDEKNRIIWLSIDIMTICRSGKLRRRQEIENYMKEMLNELKEIEMEYSLILIPTFSYSFPKEKIFDTYATKTEVSAFGKYLIENITERRSTNPFYSFIAFGREAEKFLQLALEDSVGKKSPFNYIHEKDSIMISIGHHFIKTLSSIHQVEYILNAKYRQLIEFSGIISRNGKQIKKGHFNFYGRKYEECDFSGITFKGVELLKREEIFKVEILEMKSKKLVYYKLDLCRAAAFLEMKDAIKQGLIGPAKEGIELKEKERPIEVNDSNKMYMKDLYNANNR